MTKLMVHSFNMGDVEDPEIYAGLPLLEWEKSEQGQWVMSNATEQPCFHIRPNDYMGYLITVTADFTDEDAFIFKLKWGM